MVLHTKEGTKPTYMPNQYSHCYSLDTCTRTWHIKNGLIRKLPIVHWCLHYDLCQYKLNDIWCIYVGCYWISYQQKLSELFLLLIMAKYLIFHELS